MVSSLREGTYDIRLTHSGSGSAVGMGFLLNDDENGNTVFRSGLAEELAPQFRTDAHSYQSTPPQISVPLSFTGFDSGAGFRTIDYDGIAATYEYSRGIDASWPGRLYLSPELQTGADITVSPTKFLLSEQFGLFAIDGQFCHEWGSSAWTERDDAGTNVVVIDIIEYSNATDTYIIIGNDDGSAHATSVDGVTFTDSPVTDGKASFFTVRGQSSTAPLLFGLTESDDKTSGLNGELRTSVVPVSGGAWTAATRIGQIAETTTAMLTVDNIVLIFKENGIFAFDGTNPHTLWDARGLARPGSGSKAFLWVNKKVYANYANRLLEIEIVDPSSVATTIRTVWPPKGDLNSVELNGNITATAFDNSWIYFAIKNAAGNTYILKANPDTGVYHTLAYRGAADCNAMIVLPAGQPTGEAFSATNPVLLFGDGTSTDFFILPRDGLAPEDDSAVRFDTAEGFLFGSWTDIGTLAYSKHVIGGVIVSDAGGTNFPVDLKYQKENSTSTTVDVVDGTIDGTNSANATADTVHLIRPVISMDTNANTASPICLGGALLFALNPPRPRIFEFEVRLGNQLPLNGGGIAAEGIVTWENHLFGAADQAITIIDPLGNSYVTQLIDLSGIGVRKTGQFAGQQVYFVRLAEMSVT